MQPPGTAAEDYDTTPYAPARPADPSDPFTLAFASQHPGASQLPAPTVAVLGSPRPPPHNGAAAAGAAVGQAFPVTPGPMGPGTRMGMGPAVGSTATNFVGDDVALEDLELLDPEPQLQVGSWDRGC